MIAQIGNKFGLDKTTLSCLFLLSVLYGIYCLLKLYYSMLHLVY